MLDKRSKSTVDFGIAAGHRDYGLVRQNLSIGAPFTLPADKIPFGGCAFEALPIQNAEIDKIVKDPEF